MFDQMIADIKLNVVKVLMNARKKEGAPERKESIKITSEGREEATLNLSENTAPSSSSGPLEEMILALVEVVKSTKTVVVSSFKLVFTGFF